MNKFQQLFLVIFLILSSLSAVTALNDCGTGAAEDCKTVIDDVLMTERNGTYAQYFTPVGNYHLVPRLPRYVLHFPEFKYEGLDIPFAHSVLLTGYMYAPTNVLTWFTFYLTCSGTCKLSINSQCEDPYKSNQTAENVPMDSEIAAFRKHMEPFLRYCVTVYQEGLHDSSNWMSVGMKPDTNNIQPKTPIITKVVPHIFADMPVILKWYMAGGSVSWNTVKDCVGAADFPNNARMVEGTISMSKNFLTEPGYPAGSCMYFKTWYQVKIHGDMKIEIATDNLLEVIFKIDDVEQKLDANQSVIWKPEKVDDWCKLELIYIRDDVNMKVELKLNDTIDLRTSNGYARAIEPGLYERFPTIRKDGTSLLADLSRNIPSIYNCLAEYKLFVAEDEYTIKPSDEEKIISDLNPDINYDAYFLFSCSSFDLNITTVQLTELPPTEGSNIQVTSAPYTNNNQETTQESHTTATVYPSTTTNPPGPSVPSAIISACFTDTQKLILKINQSSITSQHGVIHSYHIEIMKSSEDIWRSYTVLSAEKISIAFGGDPEEADIKIAGVNDMGVGVAADYRLKSRLCRKPSRLYLTNRNFNNKRFTDHVIRIEHGAFDAVQCMLSYCEKDEKCLSVNYNNKEKICELNSAKYTSLRSNLISSDEWKYYQVK